MSKKVAFHTLGCRLNSSETGSIAQGFADRGYSIVDFGEEADVVFINTCTVTDRADSTCRNLIRRAQESSPEGKIVVAGCYAQMEPQAVANMGGVDLILGTQEKYKVFDYLDTDEELLIKVDKSQDFWSAHTTPADFHTRAFLKIQDGCNYICSFCIIPFARGRSRAIRIEDAISQAQEIVEKGFKEIVLTGVNIGEYESASQEKLTDLIRKLGKVKGLERLRLSSVEPNTLSDELLQTLKETPIFLDHFHVPLQSGDDQILKGMRRKYTTADYRRLMGKIKTLYPNAAIGADVIVGFPGETEEQFNNTFNLLRESPITHFHVFPYSKRKNTTAAAMIDHIPYQIKKSRVKTLMMLGEAKLRSFSEEMLGREMDVLFETRNKAGLFEGLTSNFLRVEVPTALDLRNQILRVRLNSFSQGKLQGELLQEAQASL